MTFAENQALPVRILSTAFGIVPGIAKVLIFFREDKKLKYLTAVDIDHVDSNFCDESLSHLVTNQFKPRIPWEWLSEGDLPYEHGPVNQIQRTVFSEESNRILLIRLTPDDQHCNHLIYLHFPDQFHWAGKDRAQPELSTDHKSLISFLLYHSLNKLVQEILHSVKIRTRIADAMKLLGKQLYGIKEEVLVAEERLLKLKTEVIRYFADEAAIHSGSSISIDTSALKFLLGKEANPTDLRQTIHNAVEIAILTIDPNEEDLVLYEWHFLSSGTSDQVEKAVDVIAERIADRTIALLDRFEMAARKVIDARESLTGQNLGKACTPPISAPAISDALKKHGHRIPSLLQRHPERWMLLRTHFKPVQNQMIHRKDTANKRTA